MRCIEWELGVNNNKNNSNSYINSNMKMRDCFKINLYKIDKIKIEMKVVDCFGILVSFLFLLVRS